MLPAVRTPRATTHCRTSATLGLERRTTAFVMWGTGRIAPPGLLSEHDAELEGEPPSGYRERQEQPMPYHRSFPLQWRGEISAPPFGRPVASPAGRRRYRAIGIGCRSFVASLSCHFRAELCPTVPFSFGARWTRGVWGVLLLSSASFFWFEPDWIDIAARSEPDIVYRLGLSCFPRFITARRLSGGFRVIRAHS